MRLGIVADDLTGAMDAAAAFADRGRKTLVLLDREAPFDDEAHVVSIDTHSRDVSPQAAADAVRTAMARVSASGRLPFKKIDSTLRGNLGAEIGAALQASGRRCAIVAPAAPAQGRVLRGGRLFVDGAPAGQTSLVDTLRADLPDLDVRAFVSREPPVPGDRRCVYVADAQTDDDLDRLAALGLSCPEDVLLVGSSGLGSAIARRTAAGAAAHTPVARGYRRLWLVVGSHNARSAEQVRALAGRPDMSTVVLPLADAPIAIPDAHALAPLVLVHVEGLGGPALADPRRIAARLAELTAGLLGAQPVPGTALFMTGGDTARAILSRVGVRSIEVIGSAAPGVVHGTVTFGGHAIGIVTKAGGFGQPQLFVQLARDLLA